jgi:two-component system sensor histidine kinase RegB
MMTVLVLLALVNLATLVLSIGRRGFSYIELLGSLMLDVSALAWQLYQTGGGTNPFAFLFLLQIVIGAILLPPRWSWIIAALAGCDATFLTFFFQPLTLPDVYEGVHFQLYLIGSLLCFLLIGSLLVFFVGRIDRNRRASDARLAALSQRAAEEDHIVRLGLLASGAAHELGTPLASMSVILGDWAHHPSVKQDSDLAEDVALMQGELKRCKAILSGMLISAAKSGARTRRSPRSAPSSMISSRTGASAPLPHRLHRHRRGHRHRRRPRAASGAQQHRRQCHRRLTHRHHHRARSDRDWLSIVTTDDGPGFAAQVIDQIGKPYVSTKGRDGGGLGLFLVVNVARKLGGRLKVENREEGGARSP